LSSAVTQLHSGLATDSANVDRALRGTEDGGGGGGFNVRVQLPIGKSLLGSLSTNSARLQRRRHFSNCCATRLLDRQRRHPFSFPPRTDVPQQRSSANRRASCTSDSPAGFHVDIDDWTGRRGQILHFVDACMEWRGGWWMIGPRLVDGVGVIMTARTTDAEVDTPSDGRTPH